MISVLLRWLEAQQGCWAGPPDALVDPVSGDILSAAVVRYHVALCVQAHFLISKGKGRRLRLQLTWLGHDFLAGSRLK